MKRNVGNLDAIFRLILGGMLVFVGLYVLDGYRGKVIGILVALFSLMPFYMAITRKCFVFRFFGISSIPKEKTDPK